MSTTEYAGWWWIPENPDESVPGTLRFTQEEGLRLSLQGSFGDNYDLGQTLPLILGVVPNLWVTLVSASLARTQIHSPGFDSTEYRVGIAYLGEHFETIEALRFSELEMQLTHLGDWLAESKIHWRNPSIDDSAKRYEFGYEHQKPEPEPIEGGTAVVGYLARMQQTALSAELRVSPVIRFELQVPLDIDDWHRYYVRPVVNLLSLATGQAVYLSEVKVSPEDSDKRDGVQVVARNLVTERADKSVLTSDKMLFSRPNLDVTVGELLRRWLTIHSDLEPILNLYFSIGRSPAMYMEHRFLSTIQALEGYHRRRFPGQDLTAEQHQARLDAIIEAAPTEHRKWLEEKLAYSNEVSQRKRLKILVEAAGEVLAPWAPDTASRRRFVGRVIQARNDLTHQTPGQVEKSLNPDVLFSLTEALSFLMQALLLDELAFAPEKRVALFRAYQPYIFAARRASDDG